MTSLPETRQDATELAETGRAEADLGGYWQAAEADDDLRRSFPRPDLDDSGWQPLVGAGALASEPGLCLFGRPAVLPEAVRDGGAGTGQRAWLSMDGIFYQSDVWLDGSYLGDTEGYFFPHAFDITSALEARSEHVLALEVVCDRPARRAAKRALMGVFGYWDCIDPAYNPGGIWAPVKVAVSGPVQMSSLRATVRVKRTPKSAVLELSAELDSARSRHGHACAREARRSGAFNGETTVPAARVETRQPLAVGANRVRWRLVVDEPDLWWPAGLGEPAPLRHFRHRRRWKVSRPASKVLRTGLRAGAGPKPGLVRERGTGFPERRQPGPDAAGPCLRHARRCRPGRAAGARRPGSTCSGCTRISPARSCTTPPTNWVCSCGRTCRSTAGTRVCGARPYARSAAAVDLLGHHPSILVWCGHDEPFSHELPAGRAPGPTRVLRSAVAQALPGWNKSVLDASIKRALERADPTRPVLAHSGMLPHPAWGTDSHLYFGWYHGRWNDLPRAMAAWPAAGRFVGELGAQAVPCTADFMEPERWPHLDWDRLARALSACRRPFSTTSSRLASYASFEDWRDATQAYQARLVRSQVEALRRLHFRPTGGFAVFCLNDAQPAVSWSLLDHERVPKAAYEALREACAPVLVAADWPAPSYKPGAAHLARRPRRERHSGGAWPGRWSRPGWPGRAAGRKWLFGGNVAANSCSFVGTLNARLPQLAALEADTGGNSAEGSLAARAAPRASVGQSRHSRPLTATTACCYARTRPTIEVRGHRSPLKGRRPEGLLEHAEAKQRGEAEEQASRWRRAAASGS